MPFEKKPLDKLLAEAADSDKGMKRTLAAWSLIALGIGAIIGAGLFVRTAMAAAQNGGPSVTIAFVVAAIGCALAGLCYAELSSTIPISGSAYTYTYATMGELLAWIIGWDLILEYAVGAATVGIAWSEYLNNFLVKVLKILDENGQEMDSAPHPQQQLYIDLGMNLDEFDILRRQEKEAVANE